MERDHLKWLYPFGILMGRIGWCDYNIASRNFQYGISNGKSYLPLLQNKHFLIWMSM
jgi:hypothetical protein